MASPSVRLWDIATRPPAEKTCCSPNPWKTRLALNVKGIRHETVWTPLLDIPEVRRGLEVPAVRQFADGSDFYTLPIIHDPKTDTFLGDTFDIAVYLQRQYPDAGAGDLFPEQALAFKVPQDLSIHVPLTAARDSDFPAYAKFNVDVDALFTIHVQLAMGGFPFDPATEAVAKAQFVRRAGVASWEDIVPTDARRVELMDSFHDMLEGLAVLFNEKPNGPFLLGDKVSYADCIVGGWLRMMVTGMPAEDWEKLRSWHNGVFGKLHDALEVFAKVS